MVQNDKIWTGRVYRGSDTSYRYIKPTRVGFIDLVRKELPITFLKNNKMEEQMFSQKLTEYSAALKDVFPELAPAIDEFMGRPDDEKESAYANEVMTKHVMKDDMSCPGQVLPGVLLTDAMWVELSDTSKKAIYDYLSLLDLCAIMNGNGTFSQEWADKVMRDWRGRMSRGDFDGISKKLFSIFGKTGENLPPLPEKFLKGRLAKLAEEMVKEFRPEDFGLKEEDVANVEKDPTRAFEILMEAATKNPQMLQKAVGRIGKKLQEKVATGQLKPHELAAEAEEMIREFSEHPTFVEMMKGFKDAFNFEDPDLARSAGREGEGRLATARARLRKKLDKKKGEATK